MRRGESSYSGRDANGNPSGFATMPTVSAGEEPAYYPAKCNHCGDTIKGKRELNRHMTQKHPA